jgi:hypothetical protein
MSRKTESEEAEYGTASCRLTIRNNKGKLEATWKKER